MPPMCYIQRMASTVFLARFWSKVRVGKPNECWEWTGARNRTDYGKFKVRSYQLELAPRLAWQLGTTEQIPPRLHCCHTCDNPPCCNPAHLFIGTNADNMRDKIAKGRAKPPYQGRTHCARGHELTPDNIKKKRGTKLCRTCYLDRQRGNDRKRYVHTTLRDADHCQRGHPMTPDNVRVNCQGTRLCRICDRARRQKYRDTNPEIMRVTRHRQYLAKKRRGG